MHAALLAPEPIPLFLFAEGREKFGEPLASLLADDGFDEAVAALRAFALVDRETIADERDPAITTETIRLHRLVRGRGGAPARRARRGRSAGADRGDRGGLSRNVFNDLRSWPRARRLDAVALDLVAGSESLPSGAETAAADLLIGSGHIRQGALAAYAQARPLFERALTIREKALGPEHPAPREPQQSRPPASGSGRLRGRAAALSSAPLAILAEKALRPGASVNRRRPQQPRPPASGRGRPRGARPLLSARGDPREDARPGHPIRRRVSTTSPSCFRTRATSPGRGRSSSGRWLSRETALGPEASRHRGEPQQPRLRASSPGRPR